MSSKRGRRSWKCGGKVRYRDQQAAQEALRRIHRDPRPKSPIRAYSCPSCNGWHLTSQERGTS